MELALPDTTHPLKSDETLDPDDWNQFRALAHAALDDALDLIQRVRERPVWRPVPTEVKTALSEPLPLEPSPLKDVYSEFGRLILPFATGNIHPRFFGWVHGAGQPGGIIAEMMAAAMNSNCGGRDHGAIYVERQVIEWCKELFGFPDAASGLLVSGTSMANLVALVVARNSLLSGVRLDGLGDNSKQYCTYTSSETHSSVLKAFEMMGLGSNSIRRIPVDNAYRMNVRDLRNSIAADRRNGLIPICVIATAGTVNTGAIDDLEGVAKICSDEQVWFHVDAAFAGLCVLSDRLRTRLAGIEKADSIAFDFHKWAQVQYDVGCVLVRDGDKHRATFSEHAAYLYSAAGALGGGDAWPCEFGPELSRGFRALKVWFAFKEHGSRKLGRVIEQNCAHAEHLTRRIAAEPELELLAPRELNIVCFRFRPSGIDEAVLERLNEHIVAALQNSGLAAPSATRLGGKVAIRVNITNHRTRRADLDVLLEGVLSIGRDLLQQHSA